ncbi:MAG: c-type cytochrome [Saprospiraceae bacterium]|nr:c-type cytochrome [Saprospiraceae bacterium]
MKRNTIIILAFLLTACGSVKLLPLSDADLERGKSMYPDLTMEELQTGKKHFEFYCTQCHGLKNPKKHDKAGWQKTIERMAQKSAKKASIRTIDEPTKASIMTYLVTMSTGE